MIAEVIARLRAEVPAIKLVEGLGEWARLEAPPLLSPAAYVLPSATAATPNGLVAGGFRQSLTETVAVVTVMRNLRDPRGAQASLDLAGVRDLARAALLGWVPIAGWEQVELVSGQLVGQVEDAMVWRDLITSRSSLFKL
jgi:hypothetical protein